LFAFISARLAQKDFAPRYVLVGCLQKLSFFFFSFLFFFVLDEAQKASALSRDVIGLLFFPLKYFHILSIVFI